MNHLKKGFREQEKHKQADEAAEHLDGSVR